MIAVSLVFGLDLELPKIGLALLLDRSILAVTQYWYVTPYTNINTVSSLYKLTVKYFH